MPALEALPRDWQYFVKKIGPQLAQRFSKSVFAIMSDIRSLAQRCVREAEGYLRCAKHPGVSKEEAARLRAAALKLFAKSAELVRGPESNEA